MRKLNRYIVQTSFRNIYSTSDVHVLICPSYQLENLIAALYSSQSNGSKSFEFDGTQFGWHSIIDMFNCEKLRAENGEVRRVSDLDLNYVFRNKWTRLNVKAAKIMQQEHVIAEINEFIAINNPGSKSSLILTVLFLEACNKMFEHGLLSHTHVKNLDNPILKNLNDGFHFFMGWCDDSVLNNINFSSSETKEFLAWQTWDLTRLTVYGFTDFVHLFFQRHPNASHYIVPVQLNGSTVETLFSQLKYSAGGHLSSTNYATARSSILVKKTVRGHNVKDKDYRNVPLGLLISKSLRK